jgi:hypothetical protein
VKSAVVFDPTSAEQHEHLCCVWALVKAGRSGVLKGRQAALARTMAEHPEYQPFWEDRNGAEICARTGINPDLHIVLESIIGEQIETGIPIEANIAYEYLISRMKPHDARHVLSKEYARSVCGVIIVGNSSSLPLPTGYLDRLTKLTGYRS